MTTFELLVRTHTLICTRPVNYCCPRSAATLTELEAVNRKKAAAKAEHASHDKAERARLIAHGGECCVQTNCFPVLLNPV